MDANQKTGDYYVDIVMCIDATGSMHKVIDQVKDNAMAFYKMFVESMEENGKDVAQLRIKVIAFRDYGVDSEPMQESEFFTLTGQDDGQEIEFKNFVASIEADGGGDAPENALEAIALALKSDWTTSGDKQRHAIFMFSDAPALPLGARADASSYPTDLPKDIAALSSWWEGTDQTIGSTFIPKNGRLVAFVPNAEPWTDLQVWNRYYPVFSESAGVGIPELDINNAIKILVGSF